MVKFEDNLTLQKVDVKQLQSHPSKDQVITERDSGFNKGQVIVKRDGTVVRVTIQVTARVATWNLDDGRTSARGERTVIVSSIH